MKTLNRPMFRYGGPIKEGIMSGMKEKQAINTVGSPLAPTDSSGRQGYALPLIPAAIAGLSTLGRFALRPFGKMATRAVQRTFAGPNKRFYEPAGFSKNVQEKFFQPNKIGSYLLASPEAKFLTGAGGKASKFVAGAAKGLAKSPTGIALTAGTMTDILPGGKPFGPDKYLPNILGQRFDEEGNKIPGTGLFNPDKVAKGETEGMKRVETIGAGEGSTGGGVSDDPNKKKEIDDARIEKTKKRYYELMGIDKMNKEATYDSLIDASKIIQAEGGDLRGAIKSGTLQSSIINAISKNLDKSTDLKRQIDAAILKGEIQKDIASADSTDKRLKEARIKQLERTEKNASASGQIAAVRSEKGFVPGATTAAILRNDGIEYDKVLQDKLITDFKEDNPTKDEVDYIISLGTELPNGRYVVGERLVEKKGNEVAFIV